MIQNQYSNNNQSFNNQTNADWRNHSNFQEDIVSICRELSSSFTASGKHVHSARTIIQKLFKNKSFDLCSITPSILSYSEQPFNVVYDLTHAYSPFFNAVIEDSSLVEELWDGVIMQVEATRMNTQVVRDSVLLNVVATYVTRLLPCDETVPQMTMRSPNTSKTHQIIQTPLQLFKSTSPLVNRINIEDRTELVSANVNFQPRHVNYFNYLVTKTCTTDVYPTSNRFLLLRYLLKQFHVFCLHETIDEYIDSVKNQMMIEAPFSPILFQFFHTSLNHCPTVSLFKDITMCWLTYCRPWRYLQVLPNSSIGHGEHSLVNRFLPFVRKNYDFYRLLLGKVIKKFSAFDVNLDLTSSMRAVIEFSWKDPQFVLLRNVQLNIEPHVVELLEHMKTVVLTQKNIIKKEQLENSSFINTIFGTTGSEKCEESGKIVKEIESMLTDCDKYLGTKLLDKTEVEQPKDVSVRLMNEDVNKVAETPKSALLPDHFIDLKTNSMILTPRGQKQVITNERRFDPSMYVRRGAYSIVAENESAMMVRLLTYLAEKSTNLPGVNVLAENYNNQNLLGHISRTVMYPPVPNPDPKAAAPCYSPRVKQTPPLLKLRIFANFFVIFSIIYFFLAQHYGIIFILPTLFIGLIGVVVILSIDSA